MAEVDDIPSTTTKDAKSKKRVRDANNERSKKQKTKHVDIDEPPHPVQDHTEAVNGSHKRERKHKDKAKVAEEDTQNGVEGEAENTPKKKRSKHSKTQPIEPEQSTTGHDDSTEKKKRKRERKNKVSNESATNHGSTETETVVIRSKPSTHSAAQSYARTLPGKQQPFYTQIISQYLALHPSGIGDPVQGYAKQHLKPLLNRYVPNFGGVLLAYRHPRIGEGPGKNSLARHNTDHTIMMESINEHAAAFGWLTVEIDIFRPTRGAWLEGLINLQGEGHIGVVCWGMFNASIESGRLPRGWRWIGKHSDRNKEGNTDTDMAMPSPPPEDGNEEDHTQVHTTGYWVDEQGKTVGGDTPICFRIKNYEVGSSGEYGYLSIEGTMLSAKEEEEKVHKEIQELRNKLKRGSTLRRERRPLPASSVTKFGEDEETPEIGKASRVANEI